MLVQQTFHDFVNRHSTFCLIETHIYIYMSIHIYIYICIYIYTHTCKHLHLPPTSDRHAEVAEAAIRYWSTLLFLLLTLLLLRLLRLFLLLLLLLIMILSLLLLLLIIMINIWLMMIMIIMLLFLLLLSPRRGRPPDGEAGRPRGAPRQPARGIIIIIVL